MMHGPINTRLTRVCLVKKLKKAVVELFQMNTTNREKDQANKKACNMLWTPQQKADSVLVLQL